MFRLWAYAIFLHGFVLLTGTAVSWRRVRPYLASAAAFGAIALAGVAADAFLVEPHWIEVSHRQIASRKIHHSIRIVVVADLQTDCFGSYERSVLRQALAEKPDLILLAGDYIQVSDREQPVLRSELRDFLREIKFSAPLGVFAVRGNVEPNEWKEMFSGLGVTTVETSRSFDLDGLQLTCLGMVDSFNPNLEISAAARTSFTWSWAMRPTLRWDGSRRICCWPAIRMAARFDCLGLERRSRIRTYRGRGRPAGPSCPAAGSCWYRGDWRGAGLCAADAISLPPRTDGDRPDGGRRSTWGRRRQSPVARAAVGIYRQTEICGDVSELSPAAFQRWGRELGRQLPPASKFIVGGDVRRFTPVFLTALIDGACEAGLDVVNLGQLPTPMIYYAKRRLHADGCAIVTASHNDASMNGLQWMLHDRPPMPDEVAQMEHGGEEGFGNGRAATAPRDLDVSFDYVACLQETFVACLDVQRHVVLDPMHGAWAEKVRRYLNAIAPQCLLATINDNVDPCFGGRAPDCSRSNELMDLCDAVYRERAHLGIAFDGDGDGLALVDNEGVALSAEEATWVLLQCLGDELRGERFVHDVRLSDRIVESARQFGAEPSASARRTHLSSLRDARLRRAAGADVGGHYFHRALGGGDDGLYTACLLIEYLARTDQSLADLRRSCPTVCVTPDLRVSLPIERQRLLLDEIRAAWSEFPQASIEGVRIDMPGGWALAVDSADDDAMTFRFEGLDWHALDDLVERFCDGFARGRRRTLDALPGGHAGRGAVNNHPGQTDPPVILSDATHIVAVYLVGRLSDRLAATSVASRRIAATKSGPTPALPASPE